MFEMRGGDYVDNDEERFSVKNFSPKLPSESISREWDPLGSFLGNATKSGPHRRRKFIFSPLKVLISLKHV